MLNAVIRDNFETSVALLAERTPVWAESEGTLEPRRNESACRLFVSQAEHFRSDPLLRAESFGPASLVLRARDTDELLSLAREAEGSLTATLHAGPGDDALADDLLPLLERKAGRVLWNGFSACFPRPPPTTAALGLPPRTPAIPPSAWPPTSVLSAPCVARLPRRVGSASQLRSLPFTKSRQGRQNVYVMPSIREEGVRLHEVFVREGPLGGRVWRLWAPVWAGGLHWEGRLFPALAGSACCCCCPPTC